MSLKKFYLNPYHHIQAFAVLALIATVLCFVFYHLHSAEFYQLHVSLWQPLVLIPLGIYIGGLSSVWIHNATHHSFPNRKLNWLCGHIAGMHQLWSFTGWRIIHVVHHNYSDDEAYDPHAPKGRGFWTFARDMFLESSFTISKRYREHWQDSQRTRFLQNAIKIVFLWMTGALLLMWYLLLGPVGFVLFYIPSMIANHLLFVDINYRCHPRDPETGKTAPANLTTGIYFPIANFFWHGIYWHGNHHRKPNLFNPRKMEERVRERSRDAIPVMSSESHA